MSDVGFLKDLKKSTFLGNHLLIAIIVSILPDSETGIQTSGIIKWFEKITSTLMSMWEYVKHLSSSWPRFSK